MKKILITLAAVLFFSAAGNTGALKMDASASGNNETVYLSDMTWDAAEIYADGGTGVPSRDENVAGENLWIGDTMYKKGVCFHARPGANAFLEVSLAGLGVRSFTAHAGTAASSAYNVSMASVCFLFYVDGELVLRTGVLTPINSEDIFIPVEGAKKLRIEISDGGDGISGDWGALGDAKLSASADREALLAYRMDEDAAGDNTAWPTFDAGIVGKKSDAKAQRLGAYGSRFNAKLAAIFAGIAAAAAGAAVALTVKLKKKHKAAGGK